MNRSALSLALVVTGCGAEPDVEAFTRFAANTDSCAEGFVDALPEGFHEGFTVEGQARAFRLDLPAASATPAPILFAFHGSSPEVGETPDQLFERADLAQFVSRGFIVVAPESAGNGSVWPLWDDVRTEGDTDRPNLDLAMFDTVLACVAAHHPVDADRVFVGGTSAGASFTNTILQNRSTVVAGGVVASGIFELTDQGGQIDPDADLKVIVTWSGDGDTSVSGDMEFDWVPQASAASRFWEGQLGESHLRCTADPSRPHGWLPELSPFLAETLAGGAVPFALETVPAEHACSTAAFISRSRVRVSCEGAAAADPELEVCASVCDFIGDCAAENASVSPVIKTQLEGLGFGGEMPASCDGCVARCQSLSETAEDELALTCLMEAPEAMMCADGIDGFTPLADAFNRCCQDNAGAFCRDTCEVLLTNEFAPSFFGVCVDESPEG